MSEELIGGLIGLLVVVIGFSANFYLFCQWLVYPKQRRRFRVCRPYLLIGWVLYILGGSVLAPMGRVQGAEVLRASGQLMAFIGLSLTVFAASRLLRANAAERRATLSSGTIGVPPDEGTWPPPPSSRPNQPPPG